MWYAIEGHDGPDVLAKRLAARAGHLARLTALRDEGRLLLLIEDLQCIVDARLNRLGGTHLRKETE